MTDRDGNRFRVSIDDLERSAHVPPEEQVESQPEEIDRAIPQLPENVQQAIRWAGP